MVWILYRLSEKADQMSKVAVCFAGLPRLHATTVPLWERFISCYNADVFVHTWLEPTAIRDQVVEKICKHFAPKQLMLEPAKLFNIARYNERIWPHRSHPGNVISMWHSIKSSIGLCTAWQSATNSNYDIICRARFDWWCPNLILEQNENLTVPDDPGLSGHNFTYKGTPYVGHNDQFGYGNTKIMQEYAATVDRIPWLYSDDGVDFCSELFLTANMISKKIPVHYQLGLNYRILK